jgi:hypothetical protein
MTTINQYRVYCTTDSKYVTTWNNVEPITCPENNSHTIDTTATTIISKVSNNLVEIKEETYPTGGNFAARSVKIAATKNATTDVDISWPYPISALSIEFVSQEIHKNDTVSMYVGPDTIIGTLSSNTGSASAWTSQNYAVGQKVTYTHPKFGERVYTCKKNTVSNEVPTNTGYWINGFELSVSSTVVANTMLGYFLKLDDGTKSDEWLRVVSIDKANNKVYVEKNLSNSYITTTPTYVKQTVSVLKDYEIYEPWENIIGESKIGGSYVPTDTIVRLSYTNKSTDTDKVFVGRVEYLY